MLDDGGDIGNGRKPDNVDKSRVNLATPSSSEGWIEKERICGVEFPIFGGVSFCSFVGLGWAFLVRDCGGRGRLDLGGTKRTRMRASTLYNV